MQEEPRPGQGSLGCRLWPLDRPLSLEHEVDLDTAPALPAPAKDAGAAVKWNARVRARALTLCRLCLTVAALRARKYLQADGLELGGGAARPVAAPRLVAPK